jgi:biopolymer transport protein ExbD
MAEIQAQSGRGGRIKAAPRIDLTPMVDLGFLLITFFMMTTSMAKPRRMDIQMPYTPAPAGGTVYFESSAITLLPAKDHQIFYYEGIFKPSVQLKVANNETALRQVLINKQKAIANRLKPDERQLQVLIKSHATATVNDIVGLFDEMDILHISQVAMVDIYPEENEWINKKIGQ